MLNLLFFITAFWLAIHYFKRYWNHGTNERNGGDILPVTRTFNPQRAARNTLTGRGRWPWGAGTSTRSRIGRTTVTVEGLTLKIETTAFNSLFNLDSTSHEARPFQINHSSAPRPPSSGRRRAGGIKGAFRSTLGIFYDIGSFVSILAMVGIVGMLVAWSCVILMKWIWALASGFGFGGMGSSFPEAAASANTTKSLLADIGYGAVGKRSLDSRATIPPSLPTGDHMSSISRSNGRGSAMQLLIPGLTLPASHFIPLVLALLVAQIIHEAGHLLAAKLSSIHPLSTGLSLTFVLPSAFVALPTTALAQLTPSKRIRIICAGAWHNLVLWAILGMLGMWIGLGVEKSIGIAAVVGEDSRHDLGSQAERRSNLMKNLGFENTKDIGVVVTDIAQDSPLRTYLPFGSLITHLDDFSLGASPDNASEGPGSAIDRWATFLTQTEDGSTSRESKGWCIEKTLLAEYGSDCCKADYEAAPPLKHLSCFRQHPNLSEAGHCLDPVQILSSESRANRRRCSTDQDCRVDASQKDRSSKCLELDRKERILRVGYFLPPFLQHGPKEQEEQVLLWSGPRAEILQQVVVGTTLPRTKLGLFILRHPLYWLEIFFNYLQMISFSLFIFNLLPVTILDGGHLLELLLEETPPLLARYGFGSLRGGFHRRKSFEEDEEVMELEVLESGTHSHSRTRSRGAFADSPRSDGATRIGFTKGVLSVVNYSVIGMALLLMIDSLLREAG